MINKKIIDFYKNTSPYTELGLYRDFVKKLPDDIAELCMLQRMQIIHPVVFKKKEIRNSTNCFWGDMTQIPNTSLLREDDILPTAVSMLIELMRKNPEYTIRRQAKDKIFVTCRGQAILLSAILKTKGIPARVRSGFAKYPSNSEFYLDHWITEYYDVRKEKWIFVDADCCCNKNIDFDIYNIPRDKFLTAAQVWKLFRQDKLENIKLEHAYYGSSKERLIESLTTALFYDFHCLMNNEIIYLHYPKYLRDKKFQLNETDLQELDELAELMLEPDKNFDFLNEVWNNKDKFRLMTGGTINQ